MKPKLENEDWELIKYNNDADSLDIAIQLNEKQLEAIQLVLGLEFLAEQKSYAIAAKYDDETLIQMIKKLKEWIDINE